LSVPKAVETNRLLSLVTLQKHCFR
jgi:hypothetical protein